MIGSAFWLSETSFLLVHAGNMTRSILSAYFILATAAMLLTLGVIALGSSTTQDGQSPVRTTELVLDIESYIDEEYGFSMAIPAGWRKIVTAESEADLKELEPGYAVGFESPRQGEEDLFADYILIEILPGSESGLFESEPDRRKPLQVDGQAAWFDTVHVDSASSGISEVDLTIYQAELIGLGYTVGIYAIGEPESAELMAAAFELMVRTFEFQIAPFSVI